MHFKLILRRPDGSRAQVAVTADATATVSDLATALATRDPDRQSARTPANLSLKIDHAAFDTGSSGRVLDPNRSLLDAGVRSGATVSIATAPPVAPRSRLGRSVAVLRVIDGPDAGREFPLPAGNSTIGSASTCDVVLTDSRIKDVHAAVSVGETVEIANLAGPDGVVLASQPVQRTRLGSTDVVRLARTGVAILHTVRPGAAKTDSAAIEFNRSPRVITRFGEKKFTAPKPPALPTPAHFPIVSMVLPLVMGLVLFAVTRSLLSVAFIALSPLLMIGMYIDTRYQSKKKHRLDVERFADAQRALAAELTAAQKVERAVRCHEAPALQEVLESIHRLGPLLWTHRPENPEFLTVRLGVGDVPSRCRIEMPAENDSEPNYIAQLTELCDEFSMLSDAPVVANLRECGAIGVCGPRGLVDSLARSIVLQLVGLHSPAELTLAAFSSKAARAAWEWLEWLPHSGSIHSPLTGNHLTDSENGGAGLLARLENLVKQRTDSQSSSEAASFGAILPDSSPIDPRAPLNLPAVVVLVDDTAPVDRSRLTRLAERGPAAGIYVIWVATQVSSLPAACRTYVLVENEVTGSTVGEVRVGRHTFPVSCDTIDVADARSLALLMAPLVDIGASVEDSTDLPRSVSFLSLTGTALATDPAAVTRVWLSNDTVAARDGRPTQRRDPAGLSALVGSTGVNDFTLDLREQGPHALVGGTTGSGKSEFLQSWMLGMAAAHSPDRVNFLLVDYKGGTAFSECKDLPHTVGLVTDLSPHLVRRALTSLRAEIRRREELLNDKGAKSLIDLEQTGDPETPPSLVIIVDEFAALVTEVPEFVDGVIDVAQRGRSLGLHLILATQRPAGVIKDNLRANTNLRIALRLNDVDDSLDVIGDPAAAYFPLEYPGRAAAKTGPGRLTTFQSAYVSGRTGDRPAVAPIDIDEFVFGRRRPWAANTVTGPKPSGPTDIARMVATVRRANEQLRIPAPRKPWLDELRPTYALESLARAAPGQFILGVADLPDDQLQPLRTYSPDDGNMAILGTSGSGKSTTLRTLAISAALEFLSGGGPTHIYAFDFASGGLSVLDRLPHVAAVINSEDDERIGRVLRRLVAILDQRSRAFSRENVSTLDQYRSVTGREEPRVLLLVDGIGAFRDAYEHVGHSSHFAMFNQITADGRRLGLHVIVAGDRPGAISTALNSMMQQRLTLRLASTDDYLLTGVPGDILSEASPPGRGIMNGNEVQVAVFGGEEALTAQAAAIGELSTRLQEKAFPSPESVARLSDRIPLDSLPAATPTGEPAIGMADESLSAVGVSPSGTFLVAGPPGSGRTTALITLAQAVRRSDPTARIIHVAPGRSAVSGLSVWDESVIGASAVLTLSTDLIARAQFGFSTTVMVVIESVAGFANSEAEGELARMAKIVAESSGFVVGESEVSTWNQPYQLGPAFKSARRGLLLSPSGVEPDTLLSTSIGSIRRNDFPPGRGVLIEKGKGVWLQVALPVT
ncbi:cell division protein FtsK [Mycobacterium sp. EPG1]|nr:cell division protein FtsK [Mycobacterium sp. EPG1]